MQTKKWVNKVFGRMNDKGNKEGNISLDVSQTTKKEKAKTEQK